MVKKKIVLPEKHADCLAYKEINDAMLFHLRAIEHFNDSKLQVFWELNNNECT